MVVTFLSLECRTVLSSSRSRCWLFEETSQLSCWVHTFLVIWLFPRSVFKLFFYPVCSVRIPLTGLVRRCCVLHILSTSGGAPKCDHLLRVVLLARCTFLTFVINYLLAPSKDSGFCVLWPSSSSLWLFPSSLAQDKQSLPCSFPVPNLESSLSPGALVSGRKVFRNLVLPAQYAPYWATGWSPCLEKRGYWHLQGSLLMALEDTNKTADGQFFKSKRSKKGAKQYS